LIDFLAREDENIFDHFVGREFGADGFGQDQVQGSLHNSFISLQFQIHFRKRYLKIGVQSGVDSLQVLHFFF